MPLRTVLKAPRGAQMPLRSVPKAPRGASWASQDLSLRLPEEPPGPLKTVNKGSPRSLHGSLKTVKRDLQDTQEPSQYTLQVPSRHARYVVPSRPRTYCPWVYVRYRPGTHHSCVPFCTFVSHLNRDWETSRKRRKRTKRGEMGHY